MEKKAYAVLLYEQGDIIRLKKNYEQSFPSLEEIRRVYQALGSYFQLAIGSHPASSFDFDLVAFAKAFRLEVGKTLSALKVLEQAGWIVLTESVYIPATFRIKVSKETLYAYQISNKKMDGIIKSILRTHHGAFKHPINIKEAQLGRFLNQQAQEIRKALSIMHQDGIIDYTTAKDDPQLFFLQERIDSAHLSLDLKLYEFRKQRYLFRIQKVEEYLQIESCRTAFMADYFGEKDLDPCGVCDNCLDRKKQGSADEFSQLRDQLIETIRNHPDTMSSRQLIQAYQGRNKELALQALAQLLEEEIVEERDGVLYLPS